MRKLFYFAVIWTAAALCLFVFLWIKWGWSDWHGWQALPAGLFSDLGLAWSAFDAAATLRHLAALATFLALCAALLVHGKMLSRRLGLDFPAGPARFVHPLALGLIFFMALFMFLGAAHLYQPFTAWAVVAALVPSAAYFAVTRRDYLREEFRLAAPAESWNRALLPGILLLLGYLLLAAFRPPAIFDEIEYNLFFPKEYIARNGLPYLEEFSGGFSSIPAYADMSFVAGLLLGWEHVIPHFFGWLFMVILALAAASTARHFGLERRYNLLLIFSLLSTWSVIYFAPVCKQDALLAACQLLALDALLRWDETRRRRFFVLSALYVGASLGLKYTAGLALPAILLAVFILLRARAASLKSICGHLAVYGAISAVLFSPWLIRNILTVGNPFFPFMVSIFGGGGTYPLTPEQAACWGELAHDLKNVSLNSHFNLGSVRRMVFQESGSWPVLFLVPYLALLCFGGLKTSRRQGLLWLLISVSCLVALPLCQLNLRYNYLSYALLLLACALAVQGLARISEPPESGDAIRHGKLHFRFGVFMAAVTVLVLAISAVTARRLYQNCFELCVREPSKDEVVQRWCPYSPLVCWMNRELPEDARILSALAPLYYSERHVIHFYFLNEYGGFFQCANADDFSRQLRRLSITHLVHCADPGLGIFVPGGGRRYHAFYDNINQFVNELARRGRLAPVRVFHWPGRWPGDYAEVYKVIDAADGAGPDS